MYLENFAVGQRYEIKPVTITMEKILSFAREYDPLPLHTDEEYAKTTSFGALIAPGVMSFMSVWAEFAKKDIWGDGLVAGKKTTIEWFAPVYAGDILTGTAEITDIKSKNGRRGTVELTVDIYNQKGVHVIRDITDTVIKARPRN